MLSTAAYAVTKPIFDCYDSVAHDGGAAKISSDCGRAAATVAPAAGRVLGKCTAAEEGVALADPASRVSFRVSTKQAVRDAAPKTAEGEFIDPNTGQVIPREGPFDYGHKPGYEWWRTQQRARDEGWTRQQIIEYENDPSHYQIEDPSSNRSHRYEHR